MRPLLLLVLVGSCTPYRTPLDLQRDAAKSIAPAEIRHSGPSGVGRERRRLFLRVYADSSYRAAHPDWEAHFGGLVGRANEVLGPAFGVELVVQTYSKWERRAPADRLEPMLDELESLDDGDGAEWVVGLVAPLPVFSASHHELGMARILGKHFVMRGIYDYEEHRVLAAELRLLPDDEREQLVRERKRHKELMVLLHEWAHAMGAVHDDEPHCLVHPMHDRRQSRFCAPNDEAIALGLRHVGREVDRPAWAKELVQFLKPRVGPAHGPHLAWLEELASAPARPARGGLTQKDQQSLRAAASRLSAGDAEGAWELLEPLLSRPSAPPVVHLLACDVAVFRKKPAEAQTVCSRAAEIAPDEAAPVLQLATLQLDQGQVGEARKLVGRAFALLAKNGGAAGWQYLARIAQRTSSVSWAEAAADRAGADAADIRAWAQRVRRSTGLSPRASVPPEREGEYVEAVRQAQRDIDAGRLSTARKRAATLTRDFPGTSGGLVLTCAIDVNLGKLAAARSQCARALEVYDEDVSARFVLAVVLASSGARAEAVPHLERVLALDPGHEDAKTTLASLRRR